MEWQLNTVFVLKVVLVPVVLWVGYVLGFWAATKLGKGDDIAPTYFVLLTVPLALIAFGAPTFWLVGQQAFVIGLLATFAVLFGAPRWRHHKQK